MRTRVVLGISFLFFPFFAPYSIKDIKYILYHYMLPPPGIYPVLGILVKKLALLNISINLKCKKNFTDGKSIFPHAQQPHKGLKSAHFLLSYWYADIKHCILLFFFCCSSQQAYENDFRIILSQKEFCSCPLACIKSGFFLNICTFLHESVQIFKGIRKNMHLFILIELIFFVQTPHLCIL